MQHWIACKDLDLKQGFTKLEIKIVLNNNHYDRTQVLLAVDNIQNSWEQNPYTFFKAHLSTKAKQMILLSLQLTKPTQQFSI